MRLFALFLLIAFNLEAVEWDKLELQKEYKLKQTIQLPQLKASRSLLDIMKGEKVKLHEVKSLNDTNSDHTLYQFQYKNCPGKEMVTGMELIPVDDSSPLVGFAAVLETNCELKIYLETKHNNTQSIFE